MKENRDRVSVESMSTEEQQRLAAEAGAKFLLISVCSILKNAWFTWLGLKILFPMVMEAAQIARDKGFTHCHEAVGFVDCLILAICVWGIIDIKFKIRVRTE